MTTPDQTRRPKSSGLPPAHQPGGTGDRWEGAFEFQQPSGSQLEMRDFSVRSLDAQHVEVEKCAVGRVRGGTVTLEQSGAGAVLAKEVTIRQGGAGLVAGAKLTVEQGGAQWLIGGLVQAKNVFAITVIAAKVEGQVKCLFDTRGAFAFGAGLAIVGTALRLLLRR